MPVNVNDIEPDEKIIEIEMERLRSFRNHPFNVKADAEMLLLGILFRDDPETNGGMLF